MEMLDGMGDMNKWFMTCNYLPHKLSLTAPQSLHQNSQQTHPHYQKCPPTPFALRVCPDKNHILTTMTMVEWNEDVEFEHGALLIKIRIIMTYNHLN